MIMRLDKQALDNILQINEFKKAYDDINKIIAHIQPGQRRKYVPSEKLFMDDDNHLNWDEVEELQMSYRGSILPDDIFVTLRFNQETCDNLLIDIYRLPKQ